MIHTVDSVIDQLKSLNNRHGSDLQTFLLNFYSCFIHVRSWIVSLSVVKRGPCLNFVKGKGSCYERSWVVFLAYRDSIVDVADCMDLWMVWFANLTF